MEKYGEIYFVDLPNLMKLVGFGPAERNEAPIPVIAILDDQAFICHYYTGERRGREADIFFPQRNYILADEFDAVALPNHVERLVRDGQPFIMDLGEGWTDERSFIWTRMDKTLSQKLRVPRGVRVHSSLDIARAQQAFNELLLVSCLPVGRKVPQEKEGENIRDQIAQLFALEVRYPPDRRIIRPNLDGYDKTNY